MASPRGRRSRPSRASRPPSPRYARALASPVRANPRSAVEGVADRLHSAAIRLLRRVRAEDRASHLTGPRLSALSVIVFGGPIALTALAEAEQVRLPTISRLARGLQRQGLVERIKDKADRRVQWLRATAKGRRLLQEGRDRRVKALAREIAALPPADLAAVERAAAALERIFGAPAPPVVRRRS